MLGPSSSATGRTILLRAGGRATRPDPARSARGAPSAGDVATSRSARPPAVEASRLETSLGSGRPGDASSVPTGRSPPGSGRLATYWSNAELSSGRYCATADGAETASAAAVAIVAALSL